MSAKKILSCTRTKSEERAADGKRVRPPFYLVGRAVVRWEELSALICDGVLGSYGKNAPVRYCGAKSADASQARKRSNEGKKEKHNVSRNEKKKPGIIP